MDLTRAGKAGALIGGTAGAIKGAVDGTRKARAQSEDGQLRLTPAIAKIIGLHIALKGGLGAVAGFGVGEGGDRLFAKDGLLAMRNRVKDAEVFASHHRFDNGQREQLIGKTKEAVRKARADRLGSDGNRLLFGRGQELGLFRKNSTHPISAIERIDYPGSFEDPIPLLRPHPEAGSLEAKLVSDFAEPWYEHGSFGSPDLPIPPASLEVAPLGNGRVKITGWTFSAPGPQGQPDGISHGFEMPWHFVPSIIREHLPDAKGVVPREIIGWLFRACP
ncbi:MAG TPA: hypothetical protein VEY30_07420 [Myxococcaceae bacterium]|nr:hypothetical protein [Myxococcaceae bacterium]